MTTTTTHTTTFTAHTLRVTKRFAFEAAHQLPYHMGKCRRMHGHSYVLDLTFRGPVRPDDLGDAASGMVVDFGTIKEALAPLVVLFDHYWLNKYHANPTAENIVCFVVEYVRGVVALADVDLVAARLQETDTAWAEWRIEDEEASR